MKFSFKMVNYSSVYKLAMAAVAALTIQSCGKREAPVFDNNQIITKPYSLYYVDTMGQVFNTNDGEKFKLLFDASGIAGRAIATSGENIIWAQSNGLWAQDSKDNPNLNFNPIRIDISPIAFNQSMIVDVPGQNRVYMAGNQGRGVIYSDSNGKAGTWKVDNAFDVNLTGKVLMTSFTLLDNGTVVGYDYVNHRVFTKANANAFWEERKKKDLPSGGAFFLSHLRDILIAADAGGSKGVMYSTDNGDSWKPYTGVPTDAQITCMNPVFGQSLLLGTMNRGVYRLAFNSTNFEPANQGLDQFASIRGIASKSNLYKNERIAQFVFMATSKGLYRSQDLGLTWFLAKPDNSVLIY